MERPFKILTVFGTRPEAIKMAPILQSMAGDSRFHSVVCVSGQHREMVQPILELFSVHPDHDLNVMKPNQDLFSVNTDVLVGMKGVLLREKPDLVLVQGDTTTALAGALASYYLQIPVGHVEAGLRTHQLYSPFPEEANRALIARISTLNFAPTTASAQNLLREGISSSITHVTGNTVVDALRWVRNRIVESPKIALEAQAMLHLQDHQPLILVTGHRRESFGEKFMSICRAIATIARNNPHYAIVYPVHLNPNVQKPVRDVLANLPNVHLIPPQKYEHFAYWMDRCRFILTDSGGIQEEAPALGKPVLVMRDFTERMEAIEAGTARLVGTDAKSITTAAQALIDDEGLYLRMASAQNPFGDGSSGARIVGIVAEYLEKTHLRA